MIVKATSRSHVAYEFLVLREPKSLLIHLRFQMSYSLDSSLSQVRSLLEQTCDLTKDIEAFAF